MVHCGILREAARRTLASLVGRRLLRRLGSGRGAWYVPQTPDGTVDEPDEHASLIAARRGGSLPSECLASSGLMVSGKALQREVCNEIGRIGTPGTTQPRS